MTLQDPFRWLPKSTEKKLFIVFSSLAVILLTSLQILGGPLVNEQAPLGIVSFELARDFSASRAIIDSWDNTTRIFAGLNLGLDFLFIFAYPIAIGLGCSFVSKKLIGRSKLLAGIGPKLAWAQLAAGALDVVENISLICLLVGSTQGAFSTIGSCCALVKFSIVFLGLAYISVGLGAMVLKPQKSDGTSRFSS